MSPQGTYYPQSGAKDVHRALKEEVLEEQEGVQNRLGAVEDKTPTGVK